MPPNSFMEWVIGQNVIPRPKEHTTTRPRRRPVFALELETDNAAKEDTLKLTYPRTGRASTRRPTMTRVQTSANKAVHFNENDGKIQVKTVAVQTNPQPKPKPQPKAQPKPSTDSSTLVNTSDDQEITEEEVIEDCPCANCVEAQTKLKKAEKLSKSIKKSAAAVHEKHKAKLAKETESAKVKSDAKKQKSKKKAKKPEKSDSEDDTTESESEADTDTDTESEEPSKKKKKGSKKSSKRRKDSKKKPGKNLEKNDQDEEDNYSRKATKGSVDVPKRYKKICEKFKEVTDIDDEVAFDIAMRYNKEKGKEWEKEKKALVEDDENEVGEKLKALMEKFMAEKEAHAEQEKLKAAEEKRRIEKKARARARANKEEKTRIKAELKAKAEAEAEAEAAKPLPPHNPRPNFRHTRFVLPSESRVLSVEHAIEDPDDPRPNAFYDNKTGTMRLYHGPAYGNPNGMLYPKDYENGHYRRLSVGTPHPRDNPYYNGFQDSPYGEPAPAPTPAPAPIPTQGYPQQQRNPPRASDWFQGYDSIPVGKAPDYEKEVDDSLYEREVQKACYSTTKTNPALGVSDRGGRSNVVPANVVPTVETKNEKFGKPQSNYYAPKSSSHKDGSQKSDKVQKTSKDEERVKSPSNGWANQSWGGSKNQGWGGSKNQDWGGGKNQDWGGSKNQDWGVASPNAIDNGSRRSSNKKFGGSNEDWGAGTGFDWDAENRHDSPVNADNPTSPASVKNEFGNGKKSSDTSKAGSTHHRPTKHLPGSWVSPAPSEVSAASRPAGTIPDNVGPDLTSFKKKAEGKSNNGKKPGKEGWIDADVAQTSGGAFDKDDEEGAGVDALASGSTGS
ncbi:hypothetical protein F4806DRAFT_11851 [Annulohypoxylon nitens]|nr:hypothetical protein F4806DRAFT_11851 [Annulohypoxylon nitens]